MNPEFNITVLGASRAGKTSLLSSIYRQFDQVIGDETDLEIKPVKEKDSLLAREVADLQNAFNSSTQMPLNNADVVQATSIVDKIIKTKIDYDLNGRPKIKSAKSIIDIRYPFMIGRKNKTPKNKQTYKNITDIEYRFNLGQKNQKPKVQLVLRDYPGEQLIEDSREVIYRIRECTVTMITIDTPALMVEGSKSHSWVFHKDRNLLEHGKNSTTNIYNIFQEAYKGLKDKKLIILAPVKCEKWMKDPVSANQLLERVKEGYKPLLDLLSSEGLRDNVAVIITPVETLGDVVYAYMDNPGTYSPRFIKKSIASKYDPKYCDQPLRYILRFVLKRFLENPGFWFGWFGNDKPFLNAIDDFAKGCKSDSSLGIQTNGFTVIQGSQLL
jgi:GTPase SAR1 family protein